MKKIKAQDRNKRIAFNKIELKTVVLKNIAANSNILFNIRWKSVHTLTKINQNNSKTSITNRCIETLSKKAFNKKFRLSRLAFFRKARKGMLQGFIKAVW